MRKLKISLDTVKLGEFQEKGIMNLIVDDDTGVHWQAQLKRGMNFLDVELEELANWTIRLEGFKIGESSSNDPAEAVRALLQVSGITSLPEAVPVFASSPMDEFVVFTLNSKAFVAPKKQFAAEVEKSSQWVGARQAKRTEIDALQADLLKLGFKR